LQDQGIIFHYDRNLRIEKEESRRSRGNPVFAKNRRILLFVITVFSVMVFSYMKFSNDIPVKISGPEVNCRIKLQNIKDTGKVSAEIIFSANKDTCLLAAGTAVVIRFFNQEKNKINEYSAVIDNDKFITAEIRYTMFFDVPEEIVRRSRYLEVSSLPLDLGGIISIKKTLQDKK